MDGRVPITIVNHVAIDIARPPEVVWSAIVEEYLRAGKFRAIGYGIEPLEGREAALGGYRLRFERDGALIDERICHITELDTNARRLSIAARYLSVASGMTVHATYQAQQLAEGTRFAIDCRSSLTVELRGEGPEADINEVVVGMTKQYDAALLAYLESVKATLDKPSQTG